MTGAESLFDPAASVKPVREVTAAAELARVGSLLLLPVRRDAAAAE